MDMTILVRDLDREIPPAEMHQVLDVRNNRLHCIRTTLQDSDHNMR